MPTLIKDKFAAWQKECEDRFQTLKSNEEELNRIFIEIYGLGDELTPEVADKDVTVRRADLVREIKSLLSYAVGCMFGRYSLDCEGLVFAGGEFSDQWSVISGQCYLKEVLRKHGCREFSRFDSLAKSDATPKGSLSYCEKTAEGGNVFSIGSDEASSCVDSVQYSGRSGKEFDKGICSVSGDSQGIQSRASNPTASLCGDWLPCKFGYFGSNGIVRGSEQNAGCSYKKTDHCPLITNHFSASTVNIIPICDDEYFKDDIVTRFVDFVRIVYGVETLEENLQFIADALTARNSSLVPRETIRTYFLNDFYKDHCKIYQKRPIYWLFDSGKKNGFKGLMYLHRYTKDLVAILRTDFVHEQQERYRTQLANIAQQLDATQNPAVKTQLMKQQEKITDQLNEITMYEEKVHHLADMSIELDLDDGVKRNYEKLATILASI